MKQHVPAGSVDLIITSPPYDNIRLYNGYSFDYEKVIDGLTRVIKPGGVCVWIVADQSDEGDESGTSFRQALYFKSTGWKLFDTMIYSKPLRGGVGSKNSYYQTWEYMFVFSYQTIPKTINLIKDHKSVWINKRKRTWGRNPDGSRQQTNNRQQLEPYTKRGNVWQYATGLYNSTSDKKAFEHPAIFPENLAKDHIISWSNPGDTVLDPMCGSGTTCKVAHMYRRKYIGIDISEEYTNIAKHRLANCSQHLDDFNGQEMDTLYQSE